MEEPIKKQTLYQKIRSRMAKAKEKTVTEGKEITSIVDRRKEWLRKQKIAPRNIYQAAAKKYGGSFSGIKSPKSFKGKRKGVVPPQFRRQQQISSNNKAMELLARRRGVYNRFEESRKRNEIPMDYAEQVDSIHQLENSRKREFGKQNSLLRAHENMKKVTMDFSDVSNNILLAKNVFSSDNPNSNIFKDSGRPNILQSNDSILKAKQRLKF